MQKQFFQQSAESVTQIFVEVIGPDGLVHHVGPFKTHEQARAWMAQTAPEKAVAQKTPRVLLHPTQSEATS